MSELPELRAVVRASAERRYGARRRRVRPTLLPALAIVALVLTALVLSHRGPSPNDEVAATSTPAQTTTASIKTPTATPTIYSGLSGETFPSWTGRDGDYTIVIESARTQSMAERVAQKVIDNGTNAGILRSDDFSSLNPGYYVVFTGDFSSKHDAELALARIRNDHENAYIRQIKA